jgi:uncharacterized protein (DUF1697 family)
LPIFVSMLRGINVGGHNMIGMAALADVYAGVGLTSVRTLLQSGNVVFRSGPVSRAKLVSRLQDTIEKRFGIRPEIILRSPEELNAAIAANPFPEVARDDPSHLLIMFLDRQPAAEGVATLDAFKWPERVKLMGKDLYAYYPEGIARSKLTNALIEKTLKARGTARNWNTLNKLLQTCSAVD